jgi:hypothetical protein
VHCESEVNDEMGGGEQEAERGETKKRRLLALESGHLCGQCYYPTGNETVSAEKLLKS